MLHQFKTHTKLNFADPLKSFIAQKQVSTLARLQKAHAIHTTEGKFFKSGSSEQFWKYTKESFSFLKLSFEKVKHLDKVRNAVFLLFICNMMKHF